MVKKVNKSSSTASKLGGMNPAALAGTIKESAQQIWLAGLAQFSKAQGEGGKVFETLVKEGLAVQRKTQAAAEERISEVTNKAAGVANEFAAKANGQWSKLEDIFEERVAKALNKLGVPSSKDVDALIARIDALNASVSKMGGRAVATKPSVKASAKKAVNAVKKVARKAAKPVAKRARKAA